MGGVHALGTPGTHWGGGAPSLRRGSPRASARAGSGEADAPTHGGPRTRGGARAGLGAGREAARAQMGKQLHPRSGSGGRVGSCQGAGLDTALPPRGLGDGPGCQHAAPGTARLRHLRSGAFRDALDLATQRSAPSQSPLPWLGAGPPCRHGVTRLPRCRWPCATRCSRGRLCHATGDGVRGLPGGTPNPEQLPPLRRHG